MRFSPALRKFAFSAVAIAGFSFFFAGRASAHSIIESTEPSANSVLDQAPASVTLRFNEPVDTDLGWVRVFDAQGQRMASVGVKHAENVQSVRAIMPALNDGGYVVVWRVVSADGHPVEGAFTFQIGNTSSAVETGVLESVVTAQSGSDWPGRLIGLARVLGYLAAALITGSALIGGLGSRATRVTAAVAAGAAMVHLLMLGAYSVGGSISDTFDTGLLGDSLGTRAGLMVLARVTVFAVVAAVGAMVPTRAVLGASAFAALTVAIGGHAGAQSPAAVMVILGSVHVFAVWIWLGSVAVLMFKREDQVERANYFSHLMNVVLPAVVVSGVLGAGKNMGGWDKLFDTTYGRLVVVKAAGVVMLAAAGLLVRRQLSKTFPKLRSLLAFEVSIGVVVFALTAVLAVTAPNATARNGDVFHQTLVEAGVIADVTIDPGFVGNNEIHLLFSPPGGSLAPVRDVKVRFELPAHNIPFMEATMTLSAINHWIGVMNVPYPGDWNVEVIVKSSTNDTIRYAATVSITE